MSEPDEPDDGALTPARELPVDEAIELLTRGELSVEGRLVDASNATLYCGVTADGVSAACVYKPVAGERPLWDFPDGTLAEREVAAYEVSAAAGLDIVPPTVLREGPAGLGMVQLWVDTDETVNIARFMRRRDLAALRRIAVFDAVINNADRKGGHLLPTSAGAVYGVDHGVTFHVEDKLRTVLWQWAGEPLPADAVDMLRGLRVLLETSLGERLGELLTRREVRRTLSRVDRLLAAGCHPEPGDGWPAVPWPPI
ncbi:MAG: SCO1664 family protein [Jatrophihabitans sp.]|uniref:SCO1664 family protein n=1 Tax=Jatrophihabitans sp. TaxID=1932789 RepID=UPI003F7D9787